MHHMCTNEKALVSTELQVIKLPSAVTYNRIFGLLVCGGDIPIILRQWNILLKPRAFSLLSSLFGCFLLHHEKK